MQPPGGVVSDYAAWRGRATRARTVSMRVVWLSGEKFSITRRRPDSPNCRRRAGSRASLTIASASGSLPRRRNQQTRFAVDHALGNAAHRGRHDRQPDGHRFEDRQRAAFFERGQHVKVHGGEQLSHVVPMAGPGDSRGHAVGPGGRAGLDRIIALRIAAHDDQPNVGRAHGRFAASPRPGKSAPCGE